MKKLKTILPFLIPALLLVVACGKTGPAGPAGADGADGAQGPAGPDSVMYTPWTTLAMTFDSVQVSSNDSVYSEDITANSITQAVLDGGLVVGYLSYIDSTGATNVVNAAPYFNPELFTVGNVSLTSYGYDWTGAQYRYIIVPGSLFINNSITIHGQIYTKSALSKMSYAVASNLFSLQSTNNVR